MRISPTCAGKLRSSMARYAHLSREELVARLQAYEQAGPASKTVAAATTNNTNTTTDPSSASTSAPADAPPADKPKKKKRKDDSKPFQFGAHPTRHIAILVAYQGWPYSGLAIQPTSGYPTVEGELLKALEKCRLIEADKGWEGCEFSRCGRTDRGVSGEGQVLNMWLRSARRPDDGGYDLGDSWRPPVEEKAPRPAKEPKEANGDGSAPAAESSASTSAATADASTIPSSPTSTQQKEKQKKASQAQPPFELAYAKLLNGVLPPDIRVLAWSPIPADFDARFSCEYRHYKYAFHRHAVHGRAPLDLSLMEAGAANLLGEHDFRNFCRLDGSKQIENHRRRVIRAWIEPGELPDQYVFNLIGTAFLWHQVRHIIAVLFLVGAGLERPSLVTDLLDVERFPGKPGYVMGSPFPLTLHDSAYADGLLDWRYGPYDGPWQGLSGEPREKVRHAAELGLDMLERQLEAARQDAETRAWQVGGALRRVKQVLGEPKLSDDEPHHVPVGAGESVQTKLYKPVVERPQGDTPEAVNRKWREQKERAGKLPERLQGNDE